MLNILAFLAAVPVLSYVKIAVAAICLVATVFIIYVVMQQKGNSDGMEAMTGSSSKDEDDEDKTKGSYYEQNSSARREHKLKVGTYISAGVLAVCCIVMIILQSIA